MSTGMALLVGWGLPFLLTIAMIPRGRRLARQIKDSPNMGPGPKMFLAVILGFPVLLILFVWLQALWYLPQILRYL
ncbi:hypothetical protein KIH27_21000 [Mycobacterium sp. M1]|uniref:DUF4190 domain-containing protein n=1 Tax=Mycolicibacter acidiphilus TaxID=2835306 RepID=A0ABS5RR58_9MYCO|nr:hypothetical protein [Mycolicibacter acidiphilus]MBS9536064.1 hypothetical protein [Mycolicibacter acidiphilus]